ncbi:uncharacterized protein [Rutidosis leptorrhynchoides]|uniref:uncharacterized protein n=1 Tax=Rutidosis leptorrhynchoides TaxID=125765 RepID=UPI003A9A0385
MRLYQRFFVTNAPIQTLIPGVCGRHMATNACVICGLNMQLYFNVGEDDESSSSSSSRFVLLPDEMVLQILNKLSDLKSLCICKLIPKRFDSIVFQVDTIFVIASSGLSWKISDGVTVRFNLDSFSSAIKFLSTFTKLKSLCIHMPSSNVYAGGIDITDDCLFKWKIQLGNRVDSFLFLSPNLICDTNANVYEGLSNDDEKHDKYRIAITCLADESMRLMLFRLLFDFRLLEYVKTSSSDNRGMVFFFNSREKISQVMKWIRSPIDSVLERVNQNLSKTFSRISSCFVSLLKLPVSGYVMKGVTMIIFEMDDISEDSSLKNFDGFEQDNKEEAIYNEAVMEIYKKHKGLIVEREVAIV